MELFNLLFVICRMVKKMIPALVLVFAATVTPVRADDVQVVAAKDKKNMVTFAVYQGSTEVWNTAFPCDILEKMGGQRVRDHISAYAKDAFGTGTAAADFQKEVAQKAVQPVHTEIQGCRIH